MDVAAHTRPVRAPRLARYATLRPGRETPRISWRYWRDVFLLLDFFPFFAFLGASVFSWVPCDYFIRFRLREVWRRDCALIAACVLFASAGSSGREWQRGALRARVRCGDAETLRKDVGGMRGEHAEMRAVRAGRRMIQKCGGEFDEGKRERTSVLCVALAVAKKM
ncbi:hypothetical protein B0H13DRAFT_1064831 [Mycena leptocephala]|nr:hypothetical protein B0H13DRAFT_1064831 [Mycena leptocephala]